MMDAPLHEEFSEEFEIEETSVVLKAYKGDRKRNLNAIADAIEAMCPNRGLDPVTLDVTTARQLWRYAQQIGIIAAEMK